VIFFVVVEEKRKNSTFVMACKVAGDHVGGAFKLRQKTAKEMHHPKLNHGNLATLKWSDDSKHRIDNLKNRFNIDCQPILPRLIIQQTPYQES